MYIITKGNMRRIDYVESKMSTVKSALLRWSEVQTGKQ